MTKKLKPLIEWHDRKLYPYIEEEYQKIANRWSKVSSEKRNISRNEYHNTFDNDTVKFFRRLGGIEKNETMATSMGYVPFRNTSISPDRQTKIVRTVDFKKARKNEETQYALYRKTLERRYQKTKNGFYE